MPGLMPVDQCQGYGLMLGESELVRIGDGGASYSF